MNQKITLQQMLPFLLLLLAGAVLLVVLSPDGSSLGLGLHLPNWRPAAANVSAAEQAADASAFRWQAMAAYYADHDRLTRNTFDYEQAAALSASRWQAMAAYYQRHGLLRYAANPDDVMAYRWLAMARAYERMGLLNER